MSCHISRHGIVTGDDAQPWSKLACRLYLQGDSLTARQYRPSLAHAVAISPDGSTVYVAGDNGGLKIIDVRQIQKISPNIRPIHSSDLGIG